MGHNHQDLVSALCGVYPSLLCPFWVAVVGLCTQTQPPGVTSSLGLQGWGYPPKNPSLPSHDGLALSWGRGFEHPPKAAFLWRKGRIYSSKIQTLCSLCPFFFSLFLQEWQPPGRVIPIPLGLFHVKIPKLSEVPGLHLQDWFSVFCTDQGRRKTSAAVRSEGASLAWDIPLGTGAESIDVLRHAARRRWRWEWEQRQRLPALGFLP